MIKKLKNFICRIFGIKQCACKDEHLELYEDIPSALFGFGSNCGCFGSNSDT